MAVEPELERIGRGSETWLVDQSVSRIHLYIATAAQHDIAPRRTKVAKLDKVAGAVAQVIIPRPRQRIFIAVHDAVENFRPNSRRAGLIDQSPPRNSVQIHFAGITFARDLIERRLEQV